MVGGPDAGLIAELPVGEHVLGRSSPLGFTDRAMSRRHALLRVTGQGATVSDAGSANGTLVEGEPVPDGDGMPVSPGQVVQLGDTLVRITEARASDAAVERGAPGSRTFVRAPRLLPSDRQVTVVLPQEPQEREARRFPVVMVIAPMVIGVVMALVLRSPLYLVFAVASPVMLVSNVVSERRHSAREQRKAQQTYEHDLAEARRRTTEALAAETARRRDAHPDPATVLLTASLPTKRLWERRRLDPDAMTLRVGTADLPAEVVVKKGRGSSPDDREEHAVRAVPAVVPLREAGVLGVAGPAAPLSGLLRWLVLQLAVHHPPRDLAITLLAPRTSTDWAWVRWLPQARPADAEAAVALVGNDPATVTARVAELLALVKARREAAGAHGARLEPEAFPAHVLVVDGVRALRTTPGLTQVLQDGPAVGVYAVCADEQERFLPEACTATVVLTPDDAGRLDLRRSGHEPVTAVLTDQVTPALAERAARALAPLRDVSAEDDDAVLPDSVRLLEVLGLADPDADAVRAGWQLGGRTTRVVLGRGLDGPFSLDLRSDGPHALIAGTTGAGKSELLQTMIASLAVANRPESLNLVLVDYKGGSAFKDCVDLPHTVGMVTDLDAHLVERALTSLGAELKLREHWLADAGVKDLEDYLDLQRREPARPALPRLLLVIDEFASMARELPDFVTGLVSIAQRGRSLGIHLLLATQRPSGVVSPEIRANTNLRISLRVTDAADSTDVLDAPDAARIPKAAPGRGFARLGHGGLVPFQSGRVGGRRPGVRPAVAPVPFVAPAGWRQLGYPAPVPPAGPTAEGDVDVTDLSVLVGAVREAAAAEAVPPQRSPWLEPLPERVMPGALGAPAVTPGVVPPLPYGVQDLPEVQQQRVAAFDPAQDGHLLVIGTGRSGRSQLLRALAAAVGERCSAADVHLYGLDCGNGALLPLQDLPHCGAVVQRSQVERVTRLLTRLATEAERRQALLAEGGYADITEQRRAGGPEQRLPHLLLLLDRWEGFTSSLGDVDGGRLADLVLLLLREGASVGISLVITGDRSLASGRIASLTDSKLVLRLADRVDYSLVGLNPRTLPEQIPPGRGFVAGSGVETQVALLSGDDSGQGQAAVLTEIAKAAHVRDALVPRGARPFRVDVLPARITFEQAWALRPEDAGPQFALAGVGGDELTARGPDLATGGPAFVVAGPGRSGRSTALAVLARSLLQGGTAVVVGAPRPSPLRDLEGATGVLAVVTDPAAPAADWQGALDAAGDRPVVLVLDDAEVLRDCPAAELFRSVVKGMAGPGRALVLGGDADGICTGLSGWQVEAKKSRQGLLLSPQGSGDGDLIGLRLPRSAVGGALQPGRGLLHLGDSVLVSVAVPTL